MKTQITLQGNERQGNYSAAKHSPASSGFIDLTDEFRRSHRRRCWKRWLSYYGLAVYTGFKLGVLFTVIVFVLCSLATKH